MPPCGGQDVASPHAPLFPSILSSWSPTPCGGYGHMRKVQHRRGAGEKCSGGSGHRSRRKVQRGWRSEEQEKGAAGAPVTGAGGRCSRSGSHRSRRKAQRGLRPQEQEEGAVGVAVRGAGGRCSGGSGHRSRRKVQRVRR
ncbi:hypothetical protein FKM82_021231 [Ascaphus truei]